MTLTAWKVDALTEEYLPVRGRGLGVGGNKETLVTLWHVNPNFSSTAQTYKKTVANEIKAIFRHLYYSGRWLIPIFLI